MSTFRATTELRAVDAGIFSRLDGRRHTVLGLATVGGAWLIAVVAQATGNAAALHHHALIEDGPPLWLASPDLSGRLAGHGGGAGHRPMGT